jgi:hypothetical protein
MELKILISILDLANVSHAFGATLVCYQQKQTGVERFGVHNFTIENSIGFH